MTTNQVLKEMKGTGDPIHGVSGGTKSQPEQKPTQKPTEANRNLDFYVKSF